MLGRGIKLGIRRRLSTKYKCLYAFFFAEALAFAAFFLLLRIITIPKNEPTTAEPRIVRITGIRIAQTRGGKRS